MLFNGDYGKMTQKPLGQVPTGPQFPHKPAPAPGTGEQRQGDTVNRPVPMQPIRPQQPFMPQMPWMPMPSGGMTGGMTGGGMPAPQPSPGSPPPMAPQQPPSMTSMTQPSGGQSQYGHMRLDSPQPARPGSPQDIQRIISGQGGGPSVMGGAQWNTMPGQQPTTGSPTKSPSQAPAAPQQGGGNFASVMPPWWQEGMPLPTTGVTNPSTAMPGMAGGRGSLANAPQPNWAAPPQLTPPPPAQSQPSAPPQQSSPFGNLLSSLGDFQAEAIDPVTGLEIPGTGAQTANQTLSPQLQQLLGGLGLPGFQPVDLTAMGNQAQARAAQTEARMNRNTRNSFGDSGVQARGPAMSSEMNLNAARANSGLEDTIARLGIEQGNQYNTNAPRFGSLLVDAANSGNARQGQSLSFLAQMLQGLGSFV